MASYLYTTDNGDYVRAGSKAAAEAIVGDRVRRAKGPAPCCQCGKPVEAYKDGTLGYACEACSAEEHAAECASLAYAESGGGSESVNDRNYSYQD